MEKLRNKSGDLELYNAGLPHFPRNFTRDSIIAAMLMRNPEILRNQLIFSASRQGSKRDSYTGEEPGKIFHEYPGVEIAGLSTEYNACDTTALFIIGHHRHMQLTGKDDLVKQHQDHLRRAVDYIKNHLIDGIFYEDPRHCGAQRFALKVTYWKDSEMPKRQDGMPSYPIAYFLTQAMNLSAIRCASEILKLDELVELSTKMREGLHDFFDVENKLCYIALDAYGPLEGVSSDLGHALYYLENGDLTLEEMALIDESMRELETPIGYRTLSPKLKGEINDSYHSRTVWPFEQAVINSGARRFNMERLDRVSRQIHERLDTEPEIFVIKESSIEKGGCDPQLWTIAAKKYFSGL